MKIVGINGSPFKAGECASEYLLEQALQAFTDSTGGEKVLLRIKDYNIKPCRACGMCMKGLGCALYGSPGDQLNELVSAIDNADAFIFSLPASNNQGISYYLSNFWDRTRIIFEKEHCDDWGIQVDQINGNPFQYKPVANIITYTKGGVAKLAYDTCERMQMGYRFTNEISLGIYRRTMPDGTLEKISKFDINAAQSLGIRMAEIVSSELCMMQFEIIHGKKMCE